MQGLKITEKHFSLNKDIYIQSILNFEPVKIKCIIKFRLYITGPIECRRGVLLLTEDKIDLLGGEVQEIAHTNSLAGQLAAKFGLAISQGKFEDNKIIMNWKI